MDVINIVSLAVIILIVIPCNAFAIAFIFRKVSEVILKDKIIAVLFALNSCQAIAYSIELHAAIKGEVSNRACEAVASIICSLTYSSIGYLLALAIERCIVITYPYEYVLWFSGRSNTLWLLLPPVVGFTLGLAPVVGWSSYGRARKDSTLCGFDYGDNGIVAKSYLISVVVIALVNPIVLTTICLAWILMEVREKASDNKHKCEEQLNISHIRNKTIRKQSMSCLVTGLVYFASWIPYTVVCFKFYFEMEVSVIFEYFANYTAKTATISSPVVYCLIEKHFRAFLKKQSSTQPQQMTDFKETGEDVPLSQA